MKKVIVEIDDATMRRLEEIAPGKARQRSDFIRKAIRQAIWAIEEHRVAEAYGRQPDSADDAYFDPGTWEADSPSARPRKSRR